MMSFMYQVLFVESPGILIMMVAVLWFMLFYVPRKEYEKSKNTHYKRVRKIQSRQAKKLCSEYRDEYINRGGVI